MNLKFLLPLYAEAGCGDRRAKWLKFFDQSWSRVRNLNWWEPKRVSVSVHVSWFWPKEPQSHNCTPAWVLWWDSSKQETKRPSIWIQWPWNPILFNSTFASQGEIVYCFVLQSKYIKKSFVKHDIRFSLWVKILFDSWHKWKKNAKASKSVKKTILIPASLFEVWQEVENPLLSFFMWNFS